MMDMKQKISETSFLKQVNLFLHRLCPLVKVESPENWKIISTFCSDPALYERILDLLQCIVTSCVKGAIESTVESLSSKLEHHNMKGRRITTEHLNEEVIVAWNGPEIQNCDINVLRGALNIYFGGMGVALHYFRVVKVHTISQAVDSIQRITPKFSMMRD